MKFEKNYTPWNKGLGGAPKCIDCGSQDKDYRSKRCKCCHLKIRSKNLGKHSEKDNTPWNKGNNNLPFCSVCNIRLNNYASNHCKKCYHKKRDNSKIANFPGFGDKNPNWKGGISSKNKIERERFRREVQKLVLKRDNYTCQFCDKRGVTLHVDHIKTWSEYPELRFDIDNCRTLCDKCHYKLTFGKEMPDNIHNWGQGLSRIMKTGG